MLGVKIYDIQKCTLESRVTKTENQGSEFLFTLFIIDMLVFMVNFNTLVRKLVTLISFISSIESL